MKSEPKKLIYKLADGASGKSLQNALTKALKKYPKPDKRLESLGADGSEVRFIAYARTNQQMLIGVFHKLTKGKAQEVIEMVKDGEEWPVSLVTAKTPGKEAREFVEGTLFFGVWKNHLVIHQTNACRADGFQDYLSWLLSRADASEDGGVSKETLIELTDPLPPEVRKKSRVPVKKLIFGGAIQTKVVNPAKATDAPARQAKMNFALTGRIWKAVQEILTEINAPVPKELMFDGSLSDGDLRASLELSCTKKKSESTAGEVLTALGRSLSHSDATNYTVELADDSKISGDKMKVGQNFGVDCQDKHPVHESMFRRMIEYMTILVQNETVIEDEPFGNVK